MLTFEGLIFSLAYYPPQMNSFPFLTGKQNGAEKIHHCQHPTKES